MRIFSFARKIQKNPKISNKIPKNSGKSKNPKFWGLFGRGGACPRRASCKELVGKPGEDSRQNLVHIATLDHFRAEPGVPPLLGLQKPCSGAQQGFSTKPYPYGYFGALLGWTWGPPHNQASQEKSPKLVIFLSLFWIFLDFEQLSLEKHKEFVDFHWKSSFRLGNPLILDVFWSDFDVLPRRNVRFLIRIFSFARKIQKNPKKSNKI